MPKLVAIGMPGVIKRCGVGVPVDRSGERCGDRDHQWSISMGLRMTEPRRSGEPKPVPLERKTAAFSAGLKFF